METVPWQSHQLRGAVAVLCVVDGDADGGCGFGVAADFWGGGGTLSGGGCVGPIPLLAAPACAPKWGGG